MTVNQILKDIKPFPTYSEVKDANLEWPKHRSEEYWEYRRKWSEIPKNMEVTKFPIHLDIETTSYCNLLCVMCPRTIMVKEKTGYLEDVELPMELYKRIIDEGAQNGLCSVKLQYLGEPLADSKIVESDASQVSGSRGNFRDRVGWMMRSILDNATRCVSAVSLK